MDNIITPSHDNLYAVEEIVVFRNVYLVRATDSQSAESTVANSDSTAYFQKHVSSAVSHVYPVTKDSDIVKIMRSTELSEMTLEKFTVQRDLWLANCITES